MSGRAVFLASSPESDPFAGIDMVPVDESTRPDPAVVEDTHKALERNRQRRNHEEAKRARFKQGATQ